MNKFFSGNRASPIADFIVSKKTRTGSRGISSILLRYLGASSFVTDLSGSSGHVFYIGSDVRELSYDYDCLLWCTWSGHDLTWGTNSTPPFPWYLTSFFDGSIEHVFYVSDSDDHVRELYHYNGKWFGNDLTAATNGPVAAAWATGLTSLFVP